MIKVVLGIFPNIEYTAPNTEYYTDFEYLFTNLRVHTISSCFRVVKWDVEHT